MIIHHFHPVSDFCILSVTRTRGTEKSEIQYDKDNGYLGDIKIGDVITITVRVDPNEKHQCYTLDAKNTKTPKKQIDPGIYEKSLKVFCQPGTTSMVAAWPNNAIGLDINGHCYNIGVYKQSGFFFVVAQEYIPDPPDKEWAVGEVKWFSLLRGVGAVTSGSPIFDHRIYWSNIPYQKNMRRYLDSGWIVVPEIVVPVNNGNTEFRTEIKKIKHVHVP